MNKPQKRNYLHMNNSGFTLVGVLMVLVVLSMLGLSILMITSNSVKMSVGERDDQSVFYIAEAGATVEMHEIEGKIQDAYTNTNDVDSFFSKLNLDIIKSGEPSSTNFEKNLGKLSEALIDVVELNEENPRMYKVTSVGIIGSKTRTVSREFLVNYVEDGGISIPAGVGVYSTEKMTLENGTVEGDLILESDKCKSLVIDGNPTINGKLRVPENGCDEIISAPTWWVNDKMPPVEKHNENFDFPLPPFPNFPEYQIITNPGVDAHGNLSTDVNTTIPLNANSKFNNITISSYSTLTLDIGNNDIAIVVNRIDASGHIEVVGTGSLTIYLKENISISGNFNQNGNDNTFIYLGESNNPDNPKTMKGSDHGVFKASIFAVDANIELGGSLGKTGNIVTGGKSVKLSGHSSAVTSTGYVVYAPNANVELSGSGALTGSVVSKTFTISGGAKVTSRDVDLGEIPFFPGGGASGAAILTKLVLKEV